MCWGRLKSFHGNRRVVKTIYFTYTDSDLHPRLPTRRRELKPTRDKARRN